MDEAVLAVDVGALERDPFLGPEAGESREERERPESGGELLGNGLEVVQRLEGEHLAALRLRVGDEPGVKTRQESVKTRQAGLTARLAVPEDRVARNSPLLVIAFGVISESLEDQILELFVSYQEADSVVRAWDADEPAEAGDLRIEQIELVTGGLN